MVLIAGPCVIESEEHVNRMADAIAAIAAEAGFPYVFKASFDKANRTSLKGYRGPASPKGCAFWAACGSAAFPSSPIFTSPPRPDRPPRWPTSCRSRHSSAARPICCSKPATPAKSSTSRKASSSRPHDIHHAADKVASTGNNRVVLTERGSSFGYNNLVVDMRGLRIMADSRLAGGFRRHAQRAAARAARAASSGGQPQFIEPLAAAAVAAGMSGIFVEVHDEPGKALSDGPNALRLNLLPGFLRKLRLIDEALYR